VFHRFAAKLTLVCYSAIALGGQGLHLLQHEHGHDDHDDHPPALVAANHDGAGHQCTDDAQTLAERVAPGQHKAVVSDSHEDRDHDNEHCAVCQHHSLGQLFVAAAPVEFVLGVCALLSTPAPQTIVCPALFSPAQPRAPPIA
jgi:hypothetical protein